MVQNLLQFKNDHINLTYIKLNYFKKYIKRSFQFLIRMS